MLQFVTFFLNICVLQSPCCSTCRAEKAELRRSSVLSQALHRAETGEQIAGDETPLVGCSPHGTDKEPTEGGTGCGRSLPSTEWEYQLFLKKHTHTHTK